MSGSTASPTADREMVLTRVFDAPRDLVYEAWTDPAHLAHWWGPNGFTITTHSLDFQPGGHWRFICTDPTAATIRTTSSTWKLPHPSASSTSTSRKKEPSP